MIEISKAKLTGDMGSLGQASNKLIQQFNFPFRYEEDEQLIQADHDRMFEWDYTHTTETFKRHMATGSMGLPCWVQQHATDDQVLELLKDLFKVNETYPDIEWTGFRITGTVNRSNGNPVYSLWLFAKRKGSKTKVYSGDNAPNVEGGYGSKSQFASRSSTEWGRYKLGHLNLTKHQKTVMARLESGDSLYSKVCGTTTAACIKYFFQNGESITERTQRVLGCAGLIRLTINHYPTKGGRSSSRLWVAENDERK